MASEPLELEEILARFPAYGSCKRGEYRIAGDDLEGARKSLWDACTKRVDRTPKSIAFGSYEFLKRGWEWAVFKDGDSVVKVPAGMFPETKDPRYLRNTEYNYEIIRKYLDHRFVAETRFSGTQPNIRQPCLNRTGETLRVVRGACDPLMWKALCQQLLCLLDAQEWLPDLGEETFRLNRNGCSFGVLNFMVDQPGTPKLIDFTSYFDEFRLHEQRMRQKVQLYRHRLLEIIEALTRW